MRNLIIALVITLVFISCDRQKVYEQYTTIKNQSWNNFDVLHFNVNITDTASAHNVYIAVRNTGQYEFSNLYLFVTAHSPNEVINKDTTEIILANEHGKWLGKGSASVYTYYFPYLRNVRFSTRGIYTFDIEQAMWIKDLKHISDIGLRIEKVREK